MTTRVHGTAMALAATMFCGVLALVGCASAGAPGAAPADSSAGPVQVPLLKTPHAATVMDTGQGAQLCLGMVLESYPPQCGGPEVIGWDWSDWDGTYEQVGTVRWGEYTLTGTYDAGEFAFTPQTVHPWDSEQANRVDGGAGLLLDTPCAPPEGGWRVHDAARTTEQTMQQTFELAQQMPGYTVSWVDRSLVPTAGAEATLEEQLAETAPYPELTIVNVKIVGDVEDAAEKLRAIWGGMLCVSEGEHTEAELQAIGQELQTMLMSATSRGVLGISPDGMAGTVYVQVIHDDGSLQRELDAKYGAGLVHVDAALIPAE